MPDMNPELKAAEQAHFAAELSDGLKILMDGLKVPMGTSYRVEKVGPTTVQLKIEFDPDPWYFWVIVSYPYNDSELFQTILERAKDAGVPKAMVTQIVEAVYRQP